MEERGDIEILNMPLIDLMWESQCSQEIQQLQHSISIIVQRKNCGCEKIVRIVANQFIVLAKSKVIHNFKLKMF